MRLDHLPKLGARHFLLKYLVEDVVLRDRETVLPVLGRSLPHKGRSRLQVSTE